VVEVPLVPEMFWFKPVVGRAEDEIVRLGFGFSISGSQ
jgi:hypothetical protein